MTQRVISPCLQLPKEQFHPSTSHAPSPSLTLSPPFPHSLIHPSYHHLHFLTSPSLTPSHPHTLTPSSLTLTPSHPHSLTPSSSPSSLTLSLSHLHTHSLTPSHHPPSHPLTLPFSHPPTLTPFTVHEGSFAFRRKHGVLYRGIPITEWETFSATQGWTPLCPGGFCKGR